MCRLAAARSEDTVPECVEEYVETSGSPRRHEEKQFAVPAGHGSNEKKGQPPSKSRDDGEAAEPPRNWEISISEGRTTHVDWRSFLPERVGVDIAKRYGLESSSLGEGCDGKVVVASDNKLTSRRVAVKKVLKTSANKTAGLGREVRIMKELDHPNICKLLETYEHGMHLYYVMELCEGGELFDRIVDNGGLQEALAADIVAQVASALKYAHGRGIAHRDIKPENICFATTDQGNAHVKLIDWGLGSHFHETAMRSNVGSDTYTAPEVMTASTRGEYTSAADLWSFGVLAYVMLAAAPPFWGSWLARLASMRAQQYPIAGGVWDSVSGDVVDFIRALLRPVPEERMSIERVLEHPWLRRKARTADPSTTTEVLGNLCALGESSLADAVCRAAVARQLDHRHLSGIRAVFQELDEDGDGELSLAELRGGLGRAFGADSAECARAREILQRCDLDGSGSISFTEFCAMSLGHLMGSKEEALWAAFKALDLENEGRITEANLGEIMRRAQRGIQPKALFEALLEETFGRYGSTCGEMDFVAWTELIRCILSKPVHAGSGDAASCERSGEPAVSPWSGRIEATEEEASPGSEPADRPRFAGA